MDDINVEKRILLIKAANGYVVEIQEKQRPPYEKEVKWAPAGVPIIASSIQELNEIVALYMLPPIMKGA